MTEAEIEALAVKHEAFGFGATDAKGCTTHGFDPDGLAAFAKELIRREREACEMIAISWSDKSYEADQIARDIRARAAAAMAG